MKKTLLSTIIICLLLLFTATYAQAQWHRIVHTPGVKSGHALAYDPDRDVIVMWDGGPGTETWEFNGQSWYLAANKGPGQRFGVSLAWDENLKKIIMFGGEVGSQFNNETWAWDGRRWEQLKSNGPDPRARAAMAWDPNRGGLVLFGGQFLDVGVNKVFDDTWLWNGRRWKKLDVSGPGKREGAVMIHNRADDTVMLRGGNDSPGANPYFDTWTLDADGWKEEQKGNLQLISNLLFYDSTNGQPVLLSHSPGGKILGWNGKKWKEIGSNKDTSLFNAQAAWHEKLRMAVLYGMSPNTYVFDTDSVKTFQEVVWPEFTRNPGKMAFDPVRNALVLYGAGEVEEFPPAHANTWEWNGAGWQLVSQEGPGNLSSSALAWFPPLEEVVLFGGSETSGKQVIYSNQLWRWNGQRWQNVGVSGSAAPMPRSGHAMAYDPINQQLVVFGGFGREGSGFGGDFLQDTWVFDGTQWTLASEDGPSLRMNAAMAWDPASERIILFGGRGIPDNPTGDPEFNGDTWAWDGEEWSQLELDDNPTARSEHILVTDPIHQRVLLFSGRTGDGLESADNNFVGDLWSFSGLTWERLRGDMPAARGNHSATFDPNQGVLYMAGGRSLISGSGLRDDFWAWGPYLYSRTPRADYDGDGRADPAVFDPVTRFWSFLDDEGRRNRFGRPGAVPFAADFDGDGRAEMGYFDSHRGTWNVRGEKKIRNFGRAGDVPVPGDYDGDGKAEAAVYRPSTSEWIFESGIELIVGRAGDIPVPGDYNGDGILETAVFRPEEGRWYFPDTESVRFGRAGDIPVPADYNGDGKTDLAVFRPDAGRWLIKGQSNQRLGAIGDIPVPADYNGNGSANIAVYRPSSGEWLFIGRKNILLGGPGLIPVP